MERAAALLRYLADTADRASCTVSQIARTLDLNKSTCSNILRTLEAVGLTEYLADSKSYRLGPSLIGLAAKATRGRKFPNVGMPHLKALTGRTGLTCAAFEQLASGEFIVVGKVDSPKDIKATIDVGQHFPPAAPAFARVAMASRMPAEVEAYHRRWGTPAFTERTLTGLPAISGELARVRQDGVCIIRGEYTLENTVIAAPVFSMDATACRGIFLVAFSSEIEETELSKVGGWVRQTADAITEALGGAYPPKP